MKNKQPKCLTDSDGNQIPIKYLKPYEKTREKKVQAIFTRWTKTRAAVEKCMADCINDLVELQGERAKLPNGDIGAKGNFSVSSFDGLINVQIKQSYNIRLDERSERARDMMLAYAESMIGKVQDIAGVDVQFMRRMIESTFKPTSTGQLSVGKVFDLLKYTVNDPNWIKAQNILRDSMESERSKAYLIVAKKPDRQHDAETIRLDAADCWPMSEAVDAN